jgi:lysine 6-dehydrogenase
MNGTSSHPPAARELHVGILGAGGIIAPAIVRDLAESDEASELRLLDLDLDRVQAVAAAHGGKKSTAARVDARAGLADSLDGVDVLVNSASYRVNLDAMRACLEAGCHYIDLGGLYHLTGQQLEMGPQFEAAGLLALLGMGSSPGKTNVMALRAIEILDGGPTGPPSQPPEGRFAPSLPSVAKEIHVYAAGRDLDPPAGPSYPYAPRTLVDELTEPPMAILEGEPVELEPMQDGGSYPFPDPIGDAQSIYTLHSEVRTFGDSFGCDECTFRLSLAPAVLERVSALVGASLEQIDAAAHEAVPSSPHTVSAHVIEARGEDGVATVTALTRGMEDWGLGGGVVSTAAPAAAAVRLLARGAIDARGAMPPERCVRPEDLFPELERRNCRFTMEVNVIR